MAFPNAVIAGKIKNKRKGKNPFAAPSAPNATQKEPNSGGGLPFFNPTKASKKRKAPMKDYDEDGM